MILFKDALQIVKKKKNLLLDGHFQLDYSIGTDF